MTPDSFEDTKLGRSADSEVAKPAQESRNMAAGEGRPGSKTRPRSRVVEFRTQISASCVSPARASVPFSDKTSLDSIVETFTFRNRRMLGYFVDSIADFNSIQILIVLARNEIRRRGFVQNGIAWVAVNTRRGKNVAVSGTKTRCWLDVASPEGIARGGETRKQL